MKGRKIFSDEEYVAYCGLNCKECKMRSDRRVELANLFKSSLEELPLDLFREMIPAFKNVKDVLAFLNFFVGFGNMQTCCTSKKQPCGNPVCEIRMCIKGKGFRTCAECSEYTVCKKLDFLKPFHKTLISDLDLIKTKGFAYYVQEVIKNSKLEPLVIK
jgi:hypothetical protein